MRPFLLLLTVSGGLSACFAQNAARTAPAASPAPIPVGQAVKPSLKIAPASFVNLERTFDAKLDGIADNNGPIDQLGLTRGVYLDGYGVVFMAEMGLVKTPTVNPFNSAITDAQKARVHSAKVTRLPALKKVMSESLRVMAASLSQLPDNQQVVLAVRLDYLPWENTAGLPGLVIAKADRRSASAGNILIEEQ